MNEPDTRRNSDTWGGTWADYIRLYVTTAKKIKQRFPNVKVGGPAMTHLDFAQIDAFSGGMQASECAAGFLLWHNYTDFPQKHHRTAWRCEKLSEQARFSQDRTFT